MLVTKECKQMNRNTLQSLMILILMIIAHSAWALEISLSDKQPIRTVKHQVLDHVDDIIEELRNSKRLNKKLDIMKDKNQITSAFENSFNEYKSKIYRLNNDIVRLVKIEYNLTRIAEMKQECNNLEEKYTQDLQLLNEIHKDEYIPGIFAWYLEIPIHNEGMRDQIVKQKIIRVMIEKYGVEKFFAKNRLNKGILNNMIQTHTFGKLEYDGVRSYDGQMIVNRFNEGGQKKTRYFSVTFFRFKPFFNVHLTKHQTDSFSLDRSYAFKNWDLSNRNALHNALMQIQNKIQYDIENDISNFQDYVMSLGNIKDMVTSASDRIQKIVRYLKEIEKEFEEQYHLYSNSIKQLENMNENLLNQMGLQKSLTAQDITKYINSKKAKKAQAENNFTYQFVIMESLPAVDFKNTIKHTIENGFDRLNEMVKQQGISIDCIVNMGTVQQITEQNLVIRPHFTHVDVKPYTDREKAGVMITLSVRYETALSDNIPVPVTPEKPQKHIAYVKKRTSSEIDYTEKAMGLNISMKRIRANNQSYYISKSDITKKQFMTFIQDEGKSMNQYIKGQFCAKIIETYNDNYPMICVNDTGIKDFINWLVKRTGKKYRLPSQAQKKGYKLYKSNGFRVVFIEE
jgi:recombinational DNA repair protein RecR